MNTSQRNLQTIGPGPLADQHQVTAYFEIDAPFWDRIYESDDVFAVIHQHRQLAALQMVDRLRLTVGTPVLEVGCGAGHFSMALARRGHRITATDSAPAMVEATRRHAAESGLQASMTIAIADAQALPFAGASFTVVVALGVIPWLPSPQQALVEMVRVLRPGGHLVVNADNRWRLNHLIDPMLTPALAPLRGWWRRLSGQGTSSRRIRTTMHRRGEFKAMLEAAGLQLVSGQTFGFGPISFLGWRVLPERLGVRIHRFLQRLADRDIPMIRSGGAQYLVLAIKPPER